MGLQFTSPNEIYHFIYELEEWFHGERFWPAHIAEGSFLKRNPLSRVAVQTMGERRDLLRSVTYTDAKGVEIALAQMDKPLAQGSTASKEILPPDEDRPIIRHVYDAISSGLPLALGRCNIGEEVLVSISTFDLAKYSRVFTPLSELEYEYGKNPWIHMFPKDSIWCVRVCEYKASEMDIQRAREKLRDKSDNITPQEVHISDQILEVKDSASREEI
ncbi:hypothetical protein F4820DRAFT_465992 [Hypoxylon rubiginosum]|uniref:Uncharacterized protein n=1 Tax=Hypoxylon rubiginosum TaxID=110542 RepID=A0ACB9YMS8_9PEZI|nr:hypothetical protein F4820DRAFT_465992 [Hypoxylon rubiginosum]